MKNIYEVQNSNKAKSIFIILMFFSFITLTLWILSQALSVYFGYQATALSTLGIALIFSGFTSYFSYFYSDKIVLSISGARPANRDNDFEFFTVCENLSLASGIPTPKLYVINDSAPNAFATGRDPNHAVICATTGLLEKLDRTELEGVMAHELTHILNYDIRLMSIVAVMVGSVALLADFFLRITYWGGSRSRDEKNSANAIFLFLGLIFAILSPIIAQMIKLAISRRREFMADAGAAKITRQPEGLMRALVKISSDTEALEAANKATAHMYIVSPFKGKKDHRAVSQFSSLFLTHPPVEKRIEALSKMS